jgi:hypothetical protein
VAPFIAFDKVSNSALSKIYLNVENLNFGAISESILANVGEKKPTDHYFRVAGG